jgi:3-oxoisoapionate decarboxylase
MLRVGLNPYGLTFTTGLQAAGTPRANPHPIGLTGFIALARDMDARCIELDHRWLRPLSLAGLAELREQLGLHRMTPILSVGLTQQPGETIEEPIRLAEAVGAPIIRLGLTPVLEGSRAKWGDRWNEMSDHARSTLIKEGPRARDAGLTVAIEDHQDFGSEELVTMAEAAGEHVGIVIDTGNPFSVGEDPVAFAKRVAHRVRHIHLKDYRAQFTDEGYRLVRCAIGDGCVPLVEMVAIAGARHPNLTASIEPGALEARHIRAFTADWWRGYPPRDADEFARAIGRLRQRRLRDDEDYRTPWERNEAGQTLVEYEMNHLHRSLENLGQLGIKSPPEESESSL